MPHLAHVQSVLDLGKRLEEVAAVRRYDGVEHEEAWAIAHGLADIEGSFLKVYRDMIPKLLAADGEQAMTDALLEIGEEFRHIAYHLRDMRFFAGMVA
ncbi:MAG TPA: hypothetical protein VHL98_03600 [Microvirga sp.]|nr:hypothetical protein [Microvirga sp.]